MSNQEITARGPVARNRNAPKRTKVDKHDVAVFVGLTALSNYFGLSIEQALTRTLNPEIKKIVGRLHTSLQDK